MTGWVTVLHEKTQAVKEGVFIGVEDCYVVTESGCRKITTLDKRMISK